MSSPATDAAAASSRSTGAAASSGSKRALDGGAAADGRRVQPRHFHCGTSPVKGTDSGSGGDSPTGDAAAERDGRSDGTVTTTSAVILHRHALESVFAFLDQTELVLALRVSRGWLAAVKSMARLRLTVGKPAAPLRVVCKSAMGRHVFVLGGEVNDQRVPLSADSLFILADRMGQLVELNCELAPPPPAEPLIFPAKLRRLRIIFPHTTDAAQINTVIAAVGRLLLLEELGVTQLRMDPLLSFAPLAALPLLRHLDIRALSGPDEFSDAQVDQLRALPKLQQIDVPMTTPLLRRLLRQPHQLQWQQISLPDWLDDEAAALLPQLPSLTALTGAGRCARFDWLRGLPNLTNVSLSFLPVAGASEHAESLVAGLQHCTNIEILHLEYFADLTVAQLADLLPRLPRLRDLSLDELSIDSLSFLAQPPLTSQLSRLELWACRQLPPAELRHVHALRGLKTLELFMSFVAPLDDYCQSLYTPPSLLLPLLEEFTYEAPLLPA